MLQLIPMPKKIKTRAGKVELAGFENLNLPPGCSNSLLELAVTLADELESAVGKRIRFARSEIAGASIRLQLTGSEETSESYRLTVAPSEIRIAAKSETGLFYGMQTLRQLIRTEGPVLPALVIDDAPDYRDRGFYHDCTRGKIPTLETLFRLADKLAYYKLNQLQLYIEHTFAFARHSDMWSGADPLTAEEIVRLDHYCRERHIDLVPSLSTFGHFYMGLRSQRKKHLNELDMDASELPFSFHDRMAHYTLNASDPGSLRLVEDMLAEFLPLFSSSYFNICCDETFDLGKGKNAAKVARLGSAEKLYVDFLLKIIAAVRKYGKHVMFWGDIIAKAPEFIKKLPADTIPLEWDYSPDANRRDTSIMQKSGLRFYVCPGVSGWNCFLNRIGPASQNIVNYAQRGLKFGASGLLNTDWGDFGHVNLLGCSYHGLALGAACAWNCKAAAATDSFDRAFSAIEFGEPAARIVAAWRSQDATLLFSYGPLARIFDPYLSEETRNQILAEYRKVKPAAFGKYLQTARRALAEILSARGRAVPLDPSALDEIVCGMEGNILTHEVLAAILNYRGFDPLETADRLRAFETRFAALWHRRNKPSEYYRVRELLMKIADSLDAMKALKRN
ncbi:MAG: family 20 glycosylhydrolase [Lentisphaeria bacterium]|nr:family 20 glycosylhydrolase [Lentisphaeria bacterium]